MSENTKKMRGLLECLLNTEPIKDFHVTSFHRRSEMSISNQPTIVFYTAFITYFFTWISFCSIKYEREGKIIKVISYANPIISYQCIWQIPIRTSN